MIESASTSMPCISDGDTATAHVFGKPTDKFHTDVYFALESLNAMLQTKLAIPAFAATVLLAATAAFANETPAFTIRPIFVADLSHDSAEVARTSAVDARLLSATPPRLLDGERFFVISQAIGESQIQVHLDQTGVVTKASVIRTTGFARIDAAALSSVRNAKYQPGTLNGEPVAGDYVVSVEFNPDM